MSTWYKYLLSHGLARAEYYAYYAYLTHGLSSLSHMSNLDIYKNPAPSFSRGHRAQNLVCMELFIVISLLLLYFCNYITIVLPT